MLEHKQRLNRKAAKDAGVSLGRDAKLKPQDVRNCEHMRAEYIWQPHEDEAASVRALTRRQQNTSSYTSSSFSLIRHDGKVRNLS